MRTTRLETNRIERGNTLEFVRSYVKDVYLTLFWYFLAFTLTCYVGTFISFKYHGYIILGSFAGMFLSIFGIMLTEAKRFFSNLTPIMIGLMTSPIIKVLLRYDPDLLIIAGLSSVVIFGSLSLMTLFSPLKYPVHNIRNLLVSLLNLTIIVGLMNIFYQLEVMYTIELYLSFVIFLLFVVYDTNLMIERAHFNNFHLCDNPRANREFCIMIDSLVLFLDFVNIFIRLIVIFAKLRDKKLKE